MSRVLPVVEVMDHEVLSFRIGYEEKEISFEVNRESGKFENIRGDVGEKYGESGGIICYTLIHRPEYFELLGEVTDVGYDDLCKEIEFGKNNKFLVRYGSFENENDYGRFNDSYELEFELDNNFRLISGDIDYINRFRKTKSARHIVCY